MKLPIVICAIALACSCSNHRNTSEQPAVIKDTFFPVTAFLKGQLITVDSVQLMPMHIATLHEKSDSFWIKREELHPILEIFTKPEIREFNFTPWFKETRFNDLSLNSVTFTYEPYKPIPDSIPLRRWNVYVNPETGKVTKVYMVKSEKRNDSSYTYQLTWHTDRWAKINTLYNKADGSQELIREDQYIWDFND